MRTLRGLVALLTIFVVSRTAMAHFLWLDVSSAEPTVAKLWFAETFSPGDVKLLDKVSQTKAWVVDRDGSKQPLELKKETSGEEGAWTAAIEAGEGNKAPASVDATCDYGVVSRGGSTFLLQYCARHVIGKAHGSTDAGHSDFALDVKAWPEGNALGLAVQFEGKPATDAQLFAIGPDNEEHELKLDQAGHATLANAAPGQYAMRAGLRQKLAGERDGKQYDEVRHWSTLTFELAQDQKTVNTSTSDKNLVAENTLAANASPKSAEKGSDKKSEAGDPAAIEMLRKAREGRAIWENFPGFTADVMVTLDGKQEKGSLSVDESTTSSAKLNDKVLRDWVEEQASTLVQHRLPSGFDDEKPTFADDGKEQHPLGRLIQLGDSGFSSAYRVRDNMVMEVNRHAGPVRFTISVVETVTNKEGKYLPRVFSITAWDEKTGEMKSSSSYLNTWTRVGSFDMPERIVEIETKPGERHVRELAFSNYHLTEATKK